MATSVQLNGLKSRKQKIGKLKECVSYLLAGFMQITTQPELCLSE